MKKFGLTIYILLGLTLTLAACGGGGGGETSSDAIDPNVSIIPTDPDSDGLTNNEDADDDGDGNPDVSDSDDDGDGVTDEDDLNSRDTDGDGMPDAQDPDDDGDGVNDSEDSDDDNDGIPDSADGSTLDSDGDGTVDEADTNTADTNGDGIPDSAEPDMTDADGDGVVDSADPDLLDSDGDGTVDSADPDLLDSDGDGTVDSADPDLIDSDGDGTVDSADPDLLDSDGDGTVDAVDALPLDATETVDTDGDGIGNTADTDDDGDGTPDASDAFPLDATETVDADSDNYGANADCNDSNSAINPGAVEVCDNTATDENCDGSATSGTLYAGDLTIDSSNEGNVATLLAGYCGIDGALTISAESTLTNLNDFVSLTTITQGLYIKGNSLTDLSGLDNLVWVSSIEFNPANHLPTVSGLNSIKNLGGLTVANSSSLTSFTGLQALASTGDVNFYNNDALEEINSFNAITTSGAFKIKGHDNLKHVTGFTALTSVDGDFTVSDNPLLSPCDVTSLLARVTVTSTTTVSGNGTDTDGDCTIDSLDAFPSDPAETADADGDGVGDNADTDDDNDGVADSNDAFPNDATETADTDSDGVGDNVDALPNDPTETADADADLSGANSDCNDADAGIHPGATETPDDGIDQDCDGEDASITLDITNIDTSNTNLLWVNVTTGSDSNDCATTATPCQTIQTAIGKATANTDGILVMEGTYNEDITITGSAVKIFGGIFEDTATGSSVWKSAPAAHPSQFAYGGGLKNLTFSETDGVNVFHGFKIKASPRAQAIVIANASVTLKKITITSLTNIGVSDTDMASLVGVTYSAAGDFAFTVKDSAFTLGKLSGDTLTTKIHSEIMNIAVTDSAAVPVIAITDSTFNGGNIVESATVTSSWVRGIYYHDDAGVTTPAPLTFAGNTLTIQTPTDSDNGFIGTVASGIVLGGAVTASLEENVITHNGAYDDYAIYLNVPSTSGGSVTLQDNLIKMVTGIGNSHGVMAENSARLTLINNTIVHETGVDDAYAVTVSADPGQALTFINNIFYSVSSDNTRYFDFAFAPSATLTIMYNLLYNSNGSPLVTINGTQYTADSDIAALSNVSWGNNVSGTDPVFDSLYAPSVGAIDTGTLPSGSDTSGWTDVYGNPRVSDGDGNGTVEIDMGAVESQTVVTP